MKMLKKEKDTKKIIAEFGFKARGTTCSVLLVSLWKDLQLGMLFKILLLVAMASS